MNIIEQLNQETIAAAGRKVPSFQAGDTLRVHVKVKEGTRERVQVFEGLCIGRKNASINSNFTVRKLSFGEGVERVFPLYSPVLEKVEVVRRGDVRRAKLYYLRGLTGKAARISEKNDFSGKIAAAAAAEAAEIAAAEAAAAATEANQAEGAEPNA